MDYVANLCLLLPHCSSLTDALFNKNGRSLEYFIVDVLIGLGVSLVIFCCLKITYGKKDKIILYTYQYFIF